MFVSAAHLKTETLSAVLKFKHKLFCVHAWAEDFQKCDCILILRNLKSRCVRIFGFCTREALTLAVSLCQGQEKEPRVERIRFLICRRTAS